MHTQLLAGFAICTLTAAALFAQQPPDTATVPRATTPTVPAQPTDPDAPRLDAPTNPFQAEPAQPPRTPPAAPAPAAGSNPVQTPSIGSPGEPGELADPVTPSRKLSETFDMVRRVERFDELLKEVEQLRAANASLREEREKITSLPAITVTSKAISRAGAIAILSFGEQTLRVREDTSVLVPLSNGETTPMQVKTILPHRIELEFPELKRNLTLTE